MDLSMQDLKTHLVAGTLPAMVPLKAAAELLGITKTGLLKKVEKEGRLELIKVSLAGTDKPVRCIAAKSLGDELRKEVAHSTDIEEKALERLRELAAAEETEEYAPFMERLGLTWRNPNHRSLIGTTLGKLSERICNDRCEAGLTPVPVSVLVVLKATGLPNDAFFNFAERVLELKPMPTKEATFSVMKQAVFDSAGTW